jgi:hypothetical protein
MTSLDKIAVMEKLWDDLCRDPESIPSPKWHKEVLESLYLYAGIHAFHFGYHRLLDKRFPFAIYYRLQKDIIRVYAILDCRRSPAWIRNRLS